MKSVQRRSFLGKMAAASALPFVPSFLKPDANLDWIAQTIKIPPPQPQLPPLHQ